MAPYSLSTGFEFFATYTISAKKQGQPNLKKSRAGFLTGETKFPVLRSAHSRKTSYSLFVPHKDKSTTLKVKHTCTISL